MVRAHRGHLRDWFSNWFNSGGASRQSWASKQHLLISRRTGPTRGGPGSTRFGPEHVKDRTTAVSCYSHLRRFNLLHHVIESYKAYISVVSIATIMDRITVIYCTIALVEAIVSFTFEDALNVMHLSCGDQSAALRDQQRVGCLRWVEQGSRSVIHKAQREHDQKCNQAAYNSTKNRDI